MTMEEMVMALRGLPMGGAGPMADALSGPPPAVRMAGDVIRVPTMQGPGPMPSAMIHAEQAVRSNPNTNIIPVSPDRYKLWLDNLKGRYTK